MAEMKSSPDDTEARRIVSTTPALSRAELFDAIARLLSASVDSNDSNYDASDMQQQCTNENSALHKLRVSCPGLSFKHYREEDHHHHDHSLDRKHAEEHAVELLQRPLPDELSVINGSSIIADQLLNNIYSSFSVLIESRLHAYAAFLARHALSLAQNSCCGHSKSDDYTQSAVQNIEEKLSRIIHTGNDVTAESQQTKFEIVEMDHHMGASINFSATMNLCVSRNANRVYPIALNSHGRMKGISSGLNGEIEAIEISLDLHELLTNMIEHASRVVSAIVEVASNAQYGNDTTTKSMARSASFLAMPPPKSFPVRKAQNNQLPPKFPLVNNGLDLLSQAASELPVVSPDLTGKAALTVPTLQLEPEEYEEDDVSHLSFDQCADIIDSCLFGENFQDEPSSKKPKNE